MDRVLARGRAADIFEAGPGRVLRRYRAGEGSDTAVEAVAMEHARAHGFPVPAVYEASDADLLMARVDGPTMLADLSRRPWMVGSHGRTLAELHNRLHEIPAPAGMRSPLGRGDRLMHFDLHPDNVLLSASGPVVIDWSNASRGEAADEVALTWAILTTSEIPGPLPFRLVAGAGRGLLVRAFLSDVDAEAARERLAEVAARRLTLDPHLLESEQRALAALASRAR